MVLKLCHGFLIGLIVHLCACAQAPHTGVVQVVSNGSPELTDTPLPPAVEQLWSEADRAMEQAQWQQARRKLEHAQRLAPGFGRSYLKLGEWYLKQGQPSQARAMFRRCLSIAPAGSREAALAENHLQVLGEP